MNGLLGVLVTDANGFYSAGVTYGWSGSVTPQDPQGFFTVTSIAPTGGSYPNVTTDQVFQNYSAIPQPVVQIGGNVGNAGGGFLAGVLLAGLPSRQGTPVVTDANGDYASEVPVRWSGTVTPQRIGYTFVPPSVTYANVTTNYVTFYTGSPIDVSYLAEGFTNNGFTTYLILFNPSTQAIQAKLTFLKENGTTVSSTATVAANNRTVMDASTRVPNQGFATAVESNAPLVVERAMYWSAGGVDLAEGHNAAAVATPSNTWYLAEGYNTTDSNAFQTDILLANPNAAPANVSVTFLKEDGTHIAATCTVPATGRQTILTKNVSNLTGGFATQIVSDQPIVVERSMYWDAGGVTLKGGHIPWG
jgi:hypothetical protein